MFPKLLFLDQRLSFTWEHHRCTCSPPCSQTHFIRNPGSGTQQCALHKAQETILMYPSFRSTCTECMIWPWSQVGAWYDTLYRARPNSHFSVSGNNGLLKKKSLIKIRISTILYDIFYYDFPSVHTQFNLDMHKKSTITMLINPFATNLKANNWLYYFSLIFVITI